MRRDNITYRYILASLFTLFAAALEAHELDNARVAHQSQWKAFGYGTEQNPALLQSAYSTSYTELRVGYDHSSQTTAFVPQLGKGASLANAEVSTFLRMSPRSVAWGSASYATGKTKSIVWNSTSDYQLLAPYVLADSVGGDTKSERYGFSGGYATRVGRYDIGVEAKFRTEQEYRDLDPRMRGIVTDLNLKAAAATIISEWRLGASFEANVYKQTNDVDFYNPLGVISEYQMTGLGTEYNRFSGDKCTLYYKGGGALVRLHAEPAQLTRSQGFYADLLAGVRSYQRVVADLNSLPLTELFYNTAEATIGWKSNRATDIDICAHLGYTEKSGDEFVTGKSSSLYYPTLGKLTMYKNYLGNASLEASVGKRSATSCWHAALEGGIKTNREHYAYPERKLDVAHAFGNLKMEYIAQTSDKFTLRTNLTANYSHCVDNKIVMPYATMSESLKSLITHEYRFRKANYAGIFASVRGDYKLNESQQYLFLQIGGGYMSADKESETRLNATVGISF